MKKPCAICRIIFTVRKNARTADTRILCNKCRKLFKLGDKGVYLNE